MKNLLFALLVLSIPLSATAHPHKLGDVPNASLGHGYSSDIGMPLTNNCLMDQSQHPSIPLTSEVGSDAGLMTVDKYELLAQFEDQVGLKAGLDVKALKFYTNIAAQFDQAMQADYLTQGYIYYTQIKLPSLVYTPPTNESALSEFGKSWLSNPAGFRHACGDQYVSEIVQGGSLYVGIKFHFANLSDKIKFNAKAGIGWKNLIGLNASLSGLLNNLHQTGSIDIVAYQVGGNEAELGNILNDPGSKVHSIVSCKFSDPSACTQMINDILNYSAGNGPKDFPMQLKQGIGSSTFGPAQIGLVTKPYGFAGVKIRTQSVLTPAILQSRQTLANHLNNQSALLNRANNLLLTQTNSNYQTLIETQITNLQNNISALKIAGQSCFTQDDQAQCPSIASSAIAKLSPINTQLLFGNVKEYDDVTLQAVYSDPSSPGAGPTNGWIISFDAKNLPSTWTHAHIADIQDFSFVPIHATPGTSIFGGTTMAHCWGFTPTNQPLPTNFCGSPNQTNYSPVSFTADTNIPGGAGVVKNGSAVLSVDVTGAAIQNLGSRDVQDFHNNTNPNTSSIKTFGALIHGNVIVTGS